MSIQVEWTALNFGFFRWNQAKKAFRSIVVVCAAGNDVVSGCVPLALREA